MATSEKTMTELSVRVSRMIRAPRERVFDAWVLPEIRRKWWRNARGEGPTHCEIEARVGGRYCIKQIGGGGEGDTVQEGEDYEWIMEGKFVAFDRPRKLAFTWNVNHQHEPLVEQLVTVDFKDAPGGTEVVITHEHIPTGSLRDGTRGGWTKLMEIMTEVLAS